MKNIVILGMITLLFIVNNNSFGMLMRITQSKKCLRTHCCGQKRLFRLGNKNIFNSTEKEFDYGLLEDLYDRNNSIIGLLLKQNEIAVNHTYHGEFLDREKLLSYEKELKRSMRCKNCKE